MTLKHLRVLARSRYLDSKVNTIEMYLNTIPINCYNCKSCINN